MADETPLAATPAAEPIADQTTKIEDPHAPVTETKPEGEAEPSDVTENPEGDTEDGEQKKNVPGSQRLKRRLQLIEAEHQQILQENEELRRRAQPAQPESNPQGKPGVDREPTEADFPSDYLAYERAKIAWDVRRSVREEMSGLINQDRDQKAERLRAERSRENLIAYEESKEAARERIPDFDKVLAGAVGITIKRELGEELLASEKSALLQYHLAKNPDKAKELNALSGRELAREIGRLEARVHLPTAKKVTEASPPPSQVRGTAATSVDPQTGPDDMNAYVAWRKKQAQA